MGAHAWGDEHAHRVQQETAMRFGVKLTGKLHAQASHVRHRTPAGISCCGDCEAQRHLQQRAVAIRKAR